MRNPELLGSARDRQPGGLACEPETDQGAACYCGGGHAEPLGQLLRELDPRGELDDQVTRFRRHGERLRSARGNRCRLPGKQLTLTWPSNSTLTCRQPWHPSPGWSDAGRARAWSDTPLSSRPNSARRSSAPTTAGHFWSGRAGPGCWMRLARRCVRWRSSWASGGSWRTARLSCCWRTLRVSWRCTWVIAIPSSLP